MDLLYPNHRRRQNKKKRSLVSTATNIASGVIGTASLLIATQALYVALTTPKLPPPPNSGYDFDKEGLLIKYTNTTSDNNNGMETTVSQEQQGEKEEANGGNTGESSDSEFRLVLVGDSPVEGIGNKKHCEALGGQTALAFSNLLRRSVRYWSYGKSGLTARGIEESMVPFVQGLSSRYRIDAIVVMCGVNNVLSGHSANTFRKEVLGLLDSLVPCCSCQIIVIDLIDFALLPFLPFPLSKVLSWRSRVLQTELEAVVKGYTNEQGVNGQEKLVSIAHMPHVSDVLESGDDNPLLEHITTEEQRNSLSLDHFFADDNFHPALLGNALMGKVIADAYGQQLLVTASINDIWSI